MLPNQIQNLFLDRDIKRTRRLIADQKLRMESDRSRHTDSLKFSAGKLMRSTFQITLIQTDSLNRIANHLVGLSPALVLKADPRFSQKFPDCHSRTNDMGGILKHHLHLSPILAKLFPAQIWHIFSIKKNFSTCRHLNPGNHPDKCTLSASGLSDNHHALPMAHI